MTKMISLGILFFFEFGSFCMCLSAFVKNLTFSESFSDMAHCIGRGKHMGVQDFNVLVSVDDKNHKFLLFEVSEVEFVLYVFECFRQKLDFPRSVFGYCSLNRKGKTWGL